LIYFKGVTIADDRTGFHEKLDVKLVGLHGVVLASQ
jgi:hypothetical protein